MFAGILFTVIGSVGSLFSLFAVLSQNGVFGIEWMSWAATPAWGIVFPLAIVCCLMLAAIGSFTIVYARAERIRRAERNLEKIEGKVKDPAYSERSRARMTPLERKIAELRERGDRPGRSSTGRR